MITFEYGLSHQHTQLQPAPTVWCGWTCSLSPWVVWRSHIDGRSFKSPFRVTGLCKKRASEHLPLHHISFNHCDMTKLSLTLTYDHFALLPTAPRLPPSRAVCARILWLRNWTRAMLDGTMESSMLSIIQAYRDYNNSLPRKKTPSTRRNALFIDVTIDSDWSGSRGALLLPAP